jgi:F0F1-type ATP synthase assembly protein I
MSEERPDPKEMGYYFTLATVGLEMVAPIGVGMVLDYYLNWRPWGAVGGVVLGLVGGLYHLIVLANRQNGTAPSRSRRETKS